MENLFSIGFPAALGWQSLGLCLLGVLIGTVLGVVLGIPPVAAAILSVTFGASPINAVALLAGLYYGGQYGRSVSAILFGVPGGASAVVTARNGHALANQGEAGRALSTTLIALFVGCTMATVFISILGSPMSGIGLLLGPAEYVAVMLLSLAVAIGVTGGAPPKAFVMALIGLVLARVGTDLETGETRLTFGLSALEDGLSAYAVVLGLIVFPAALSRFMAASAGAIGQPNVGHIVPQASDLRRTAGPMLRGSLVGMILGLLLMGALLAPFVAYRLERIVDGAGGHLGSGAIEGLAAPEAANNAGAQAALLSLLTVGLTHSSVGGLMLGTLTINGAVPGPEIAEKFPELYWGGIALFWMASLIVMVVGAGLVRLWVLLLRLPRRLVLGALMLVACAGVFAVDASLVDVATAVILGLIAYALGKRGFEPMPMLIAFLLGRALEEKLRQMLMITRGSYMALIERPISAAALLIALLVLIAAIWTWTRIPAVPAPNEDHKISAIWPPRE